MVPRNRRLGFDVRRLLGLVVDRDSVFEIARYYGRPLVTCLARLNGYPVGVMTNDPMHSGGALTAAGSEKMTRMVDLCDTFHLPVVNFVDNPGFLIGTQAEKDGTIRRGVRALQAIYQASVPWVTVIVRRVCAIPATRLANTTIMKFTPAHAGTIWNSRSRLR